MQIRSNAGNNVLGRPAEYTAPTRWCDELENTYCPKDLDDEVGIDYLEHDLSGV